MPIAAVDRQFYGRARHRAEKCCQFEVFPYGETPHERRSGQPAEIEKLPLQVTRRLRLLVKLSIALKIPNGFEKLIEDAACRQPENGDVMLDLFAKPLLFGPTIGFARFPIHNLHYL